MTKAKSCSLAELRQRQNEIMGLIHRWVADVNDAAAAGEWDTTGVAWHLEGPSSDGYGVHLELETKISGKNKHKLAGGTVSFTSDGRPECVNSYELPLIVEFGLLVNLLDTRRVHEKHKSSTKKQHA